jgi:hypothetical protein
MLTILPGGRGLGEDVAVWDAAKYILAKACEQSIGPKTLVVRCFIVSSGGVLSISLRDTYPATLIRMLGNARSVPDEEFGETSSSCREEKADWTESDEVISHS